MTVESLLQTFAVNRQLTYDLLSEVKKRDLDRKMPRPGLDTISKHVQEMAAVQEAFANSSMSGTMNFAGVPDVFEFKGHEGAEELKARLEKADALMHKQLLSSGVAKFVEWDGERLTIDQHIVSLIAHEVFHQGMITMALYALGMAIPKSWMTAWALPPSDSKTT